VLTIVGDQCFKERVTQMSTSQHIKSFRRRWKNLCIFKFLSTHHVV